MNEPPENPSDQEPTDAQMRRHKRIIIICMAVFIILPLALAALRLLGYL
ncbi:MAG TPA: hypothetical protein VJ960_07005 [Oceanipulchritudo sp.]|nr:hypothetical protein [Oceanipulchritudo sp.]